MWLHLILGYFCLLLTFTVWWKVNSSVSYDDDNWLPSFDEYLQTYNRSYMLEEYMLRLKNFQDSLDDISKLNRLHSSKVFGLTKFSDMSREEFIRKTSGFFPVKGCKTRSQETCPGWSLNGDNTGNINIKFASPLDQKWDWREKHVIGDVLEQKYCNGCWAFSIVGVMETMWALSGHGLNSLSMQELIDCSTYNNGCHNGDIGLALDFLCAHDYPIVDQSLYPLKLVQQTCQINEHQKPEGRRIKGYINNCSMDEYWILNTIRHHGPVVVAINAVSWQNYNGGVIQRNCDGDWDSLNHVVQLVGYDLTAEVPFYIAKNSWGEDFGVNGYVYLAVHGNTCGITNSVAYFNVK